MKAKASLRDELRDTVRFFGLEPTDQDADLTVTAAQEPERGTHVHDVDPAPATAPPKAEHPPTGPPIPPARCLRRADAAAYCGVSVDRFEKLVRAGVLPPALSKFGRPHVWSVSALDAAIEREATSSLTGGRRRHA